MVKQRLSPSFKKGSREEPEDPRPCIGIVFIRTDEGLKMPLFKRRSKDASGDTWWDFPGGKRKINEHPFNCMIREMREELGIQVQPYAILDTMPHPKFGFDKARNFVACRYLSGTPENKLPDEHEELELCDPEEAIRRLTETGRISDFAAEFIRSYVRDQKFITSFEPEMERAYA